jgi:hypothetical protein
MYHWPVKGAQRQLHNTTRRSCEHHVLTCKPQQRPPSINTHHGLLHTGAHTGAHRDTQTLKHNTLTIQLVHPAITQTAARAPAGRHSQNNGPVSPARLSYIPGCRHAIAAAINEATTWHILHSLTLQHGGLAATDCPGGTGIATQHNTAAAAPWSSSGGEDRRDTAVRCFTQQWPSLLLHPPSRPC